MNLDQLLFSGIKLIPVILSAIGSILAGFAAVAAAILLFLTLKETRKQTKLGYRGFLAPHLIGDVTFIENPNEPNKISQLQIQYKFMETNRAPLLLKECDWKFSEKDTVDIDVDGWFRELLSKRRKDHLGPVIVNEIFVASREPLESTKDFSNKFRQGIEGAQNVFLVHGIFAYEDLTWETCWVYMRWRITLVAQKDQKITGIIEKEEYRLLNWVN